MKLKFYNINDGDIKIDGISTKELTRENIHELFIMVLQDTWLFEGTIRDNVKFNKEDVSDREIWEALRVVGVDHFVRTLPGGLDYVIGDNDTISSGQKQLLTIARGMIEDAPFLILDEATGGLDPLVQEEFFKILEELKGCGKTIIYSAHILTEVQRLCDRVAIIKNGNIVKIGKMKDIKGDSSLEKVFLELGEK